MFTVGKRAGKTYLNAAVALTLLFLEIFQKVSKVFDSSWGVLLLERLWYWNTPLHNVLYLAENKRNLWRYMMARDFSCFASAWIFLRDIYLSWTFYWEGKETEISGEIGNSSFNFTFGYRFCEGTVSRWGGEDFKGHRTVKTSLNILQSS